MDSLQIECESIDIDTQHMDSDITLAIRRPNMKFLADIELEDIISHCNDCDKLFEKIIENDEEILHNYLEKSGYIFVKN